MSNIMSFEKYPEYHKRCNVIKNLISITYKDLDYFFTINHNTNFVEMIINNKGQLTILPDNTWNEIKRHIDVKITCSYKDCIICLNKIETSVSCSKCANHWCGNCYVDLYTHGQGIVTCPICRFSVGEKVPSKLLKLGISQIKKRINH